MDRGIMNSFSVLVYEDETNAADNWKGLIQRACGAASVDVAGRGHFDALLEDLHARRAVWRDADSGGEPTEGAPVEADKKDVIVVDYDLFKYRSSSDITGSRLAYLLRCFTKCGFIIVLNAHGPNAFDLSLVNPTSDFADLHIGGVQIGNPGLWQSSFEGFRPWHWPIVPHARINFEECVREVEENLAQDTSVIEHLELHRVIDWIPLGARHFLSAGGKPIEEVTFRDFVKNGRGGTDSKDILNEHQTARVAAARIGTLLNSIILPEQNALVDAPHLASRFPSLFRHASEGIDAWNKLCDPVDAGIDDCFGDVLRSHKFPRPHWLWRPAWFGPEVGSDESIAEVTDPWTSIEGAGDQVFCEDVSRFLPVEHARPFRASVSPPFIRRYVCDQHCEQARRFVDHHGATGATDLSNVEYTPQSAFSQ